MIHFIRQLEAYCRLEVIECSWNTLIEFLNKKDGDLDALIEAHRHYLESTTKKTLLFNSKPGKEVGYNLLRLRNIPSDQKPQEVLLHQMVEIFNSILQFREATVSYTWFMKCSTEIEVSTFLGHFL